MAKIIVRSFARRRRHHRGRNRILGTPERPRLSVYRSQIHIFAQLVDDTQGKTLAACSTVQKDFRSQAKEKAKPLEAAKAVGQMLAAKAKEKKIDKIVFDKSGYMYHGRVKALADGAREGGLKF